MNIITRQDLIVATKKRKMHVVKDFMVKHASWSDVDRMYELDSDVIYNGFGAFQLQDMSVILENYKDLLDAIYKVHNGKILFGMTIVHIVTKNSNTSNDTDFLNLRNKLYEENPKKTPPNITVKDYGLDGIQEELWIPKVHADAQERFYLQGDGQTLWRLFDDSKTLIDATVLNPGDLAYIPMGVTHSVESIGPRHSISLAFSEDPEITK